MSPSMRFSALGPLLLLLLSGSAAAQYMKITTDNLVDNRRLKSSGATTLTITLDTVHDRDGSVQSCNSHTIAAGCGSVSSGQPLDLFSYTITLVATGGTVAWGTFTAADPNYQVLGPDLVSSTQTEFNRLTSGAFTPPGLITLGSIAVTPVAGSPRIDIAHGTQTIDPFGFGTGFGTSCGGFIYRNTYLLGDPAFVCASGDWFDVDGAAAPDTSIPPNGCPVALAGGPYDGLVNVPVAFDGTASLDSDGNPLTYSWDFDVRDGIGVDATGPKPSHTYSSQNTYIVTLTVTDNASPPCSNSATAFANINDVCSATIFSGYEPIRVGTGRPWFLLVQPASSCYVNSDVVLSSIRMATPSRPDITIAPDLMRTGISGDVNGDGIQEIRVTFSKDGLQNLFGGGTYLIVLTADLTNGGKIRAVKYVNVVVKGFTAATVAPNPLNPEATLTFTTSRPGHVKASIFDVGGRVVRVLLDEGSFPAGYHDLRIDGRGDGGERLGSGIYFYRIESEEGTTTGRFAIMK